ncbi:MAG: pitrilysin family protein [Paracoccaceae bacterium]|nr:pitrilysin family protein [Paracoccaceae bacterium]
MKWSVTFWLALLWALPLRAEIAIQQVTSPGGVAAWLVEDHNIPFVALELRFKGGTSLDRPGKRGAINLMMGLLEEGTGDLDARSFAKARDELAASFEYGSYDDSLSISARFLTETTAAAMELLRGSLVSPSFKSTALNRVRAQVLTGLTSDSKDPDKIVGRTFDALAFGGHPYGSSANGTIASVTNLTRENIRDAHRGTLSRDRIYASAVGDITAAQLTLLLDRLLADLPATGWALPDRVNYTLAGGTTLIDFDTPQSVALFGQRGIKRDDPDFFAAYLVNQILGGGSFESRLMEEVREKRGLTYGVYSYLLTKDFSELYIGSVASANDRIAESIEVIRNEWARMAEAGVTTDELRRAKTYLTGSYPLRFDGNGRIANILVGMQMQGLPVDYIVTRNDQINAVSLDQANQVAKKLLEPEGLHFVVVGQPEGLN